MSCKMTIASLMIALACVTAGAAEKEPVDYINPMFGCGSGPGGDAKK